MATPTLSRPDTTTARWPLERILFALGGSMTLLSVLLAIVFSPWFLVLAVFVGLNQWLYVTVGACPASKMLTRLGASSQCDW
jgi:hypothetical protein